MAARGDREQETARGSVKLATEVVEKAVELRDTVQTLARIVQFRVG